MLFDSINEMPWGAGPQLRNGTVGRPKVASPMAPVVAPDFAQQKPTAPVMRPPPPNFAPIAPMTPGWADPAAAQKAQAQQGGGQGGGIFNMLGNSGGGPQGNAGMAQSIMKIFSMMG